MSHFEHSSKTHEHFHGLRNRSKSPMLLLTDSFRVSRLWV
jgi:hypothetical protein